MAIVWTFNSVAMAETVSGCVRTVADWQLAAPEFDHDVVMLPFRGGGAVQGDPMASVVRHVLRVKSDCTAATGMTSQEGALHDEWGRLQARYSPLLGGVTLQTARSDVDGDTITRYATVYVARLCPLVYVGGDGEGLAPGLRPAGWLIYQVDLLHPWPWYRGAEQSDSSLAVSNSGTTDSTTIANAGIPVTGCEIYVASNTGVHEVTLTNSTNGRSCTLTHDGGGDFVAGDYVRFGHTDPQAFSTNHIIVASGGHMDFDPGNNTLGATWVAGTGAIELTVKWYDWYGAP